MEMTTWSQDSCWKVYVIIYRGGREREGERMGVEGVLAVPVLEDKNWFICPAINEQ